MRGLDAACHLARALQIPDGSVDNAIIMGQMAIDGGHSDDPRKLRDLLDKAGSLASDYSLHSVVVGIAGREGDLLFPELIDFFESMLRVDDAIFRMTRERAVLVLADVDRARAGEIVERLMSGFQERFPTAVDPDIDFGFFEVTPEEEDVTVKHVLLALFTDGNTH
jgi:hypothetical protein